MERVTSRLEELDCCGYRCSRPKRGCFSQLGGLRSPSQWDGALSRVLYRLGETSWNHSHVNSSVDWCIFVVFCRSVLFLYTFAWCIFSDSRSFWFKERTCLPSALLPLKVSVCPVARMNTWTPGMKKINACCIKSATQVSSSYQWEMWVKHTFRYSSAVSLGGLGRNFGRGPWKEVLQIPEALR